MPRGPRGDAAGRRLFVRTRGEKRNLTGGRIGGDDDVAATAYTQCIIRKAFIKEDLSRVFFKGIDVLFYLC